MKYIQVTRSDTGGSYTVPLELLDIVSEFDDLTLCKPGESITLTVVEMTEEEYSNMPEFQGW